MDRLTILGVDFTSAPRPAKPICIALGELTLRGVRILRLETAHSFEAFDEILSRPGPWVGGFDFPFGLPRALVSALGWPCTGRDDQGAWPRLVSHLAALPRTEMVRMFRAWCDARPPGSKFAHRATDLRAGSSPSMKWVNPPVAFMLQAGAPRLLAAGVTLPGIHAADPTRIALEAYPGMAARAVIGRVSYKSDSVTGRTDARTEARAGIVGAIGQGAVQGVRATMTPEVREACISDPRGDALDAVLCAIQAAAAARQARHGWGLPESVDPIEGWITGC